jgi:hypothetical protein
MEELSGHRRRIDVLINILKPVQAITPDARLLAFNSIVMEIAPGAPVPEPSGGTDLAMALDYAAELKPRCVVVISDGVPVDADAAFAAARRLGCDIASYFAGDESDHAAVAFMRALAWCSNDGLGHAAVADLQNPKQLADDLRLLLSGPAS